MQRKSFVYLGLTLFLLTLALFASGCTLTPQMTYQGRLTDASGAPLEGDYRFTFLHLDCTRQ